MHRTLLLAFALALVPVFGGCVTKDGGDGGPGTNTTAPTSAMNGTLPAPISDSRQVVGGADPLNTAGQPQCSTPQAQCVRYPFQLNATATVTATLTWTVPANDFDLAIFQDGASVTAGEGGSQPPGTEESIETELEAGSYEVVVIPWSVAQDTYTLDVTFA